MPLQPGQVKVTTSENFDPLPMGKYTVQIQDVNAVTQINKWKGVEETLLKYTFVVLDDKPMSAKDGEGNPVQVTVRGRFLWSRVRPVVNPRSYFYKLIRAVVGRDLEKEEKESFDPESIVGKQVDVLIEQNPDKKDPSIVYNNIKSFGQTTEPLPAYEKQEVQTSSAPATPTQAPEIKKATDPDVFLDELDKEISETEKDPIMEATKGPDKKESPAVKLAKAKLALAEAEANVAK